MRTNFQQMIDNAIADGKQARIDDAAIQFRNRPRQETEEQDVENQPENKSQNRSVQEQVEYLKNRNIPEEHARQLYEPHPQKAKETVFPIKNTKSRVWFVGIGGIGLVLGFGLSLCFHQGPQRQAWASVGEERLYHQLAIANGGTEIINHCRTAGKVMTSSNGKTRAACLLWPAS